MDIIWIVIAVIAVLLIICYNTLVKKRNQVDNAFASIDVMLKKRYMYGELPKVALPSR